MKRILAVSLISVALMAVVDAVISPGYLPKSIAKLFLFLLVPIIFSGANSRAVRLFRVNDKRELVQSMVLGAGVYAVIIIAYFVLLPYLDMERIRSLLETNLGVNRGNFLIVAIYISVFNSMLEEFFFRGYIFLGLKARTDRFKAHALSAGIFAAYHIAILNGWFSPIILGLALLGLFIGGVIFNLLNEKHGNIISSWVVHMAANSAINTIGLMMFKIF